MDEYWEVVRTFQRRSGWAADEDRVLGLFLNVLVPRIKDRILCMLRRSWTAELRPLIYLPTEKKSDCPGGILSPVAVNSTVFSLNFISSLQNSNDLICFPSKKCKAPNCDISCQGPRATVLHTHTHTHNRCKERLYSSHS